MRTKRSLGQNFLKSERALDKIVEAGEILPGESILEIGPGKGALTDKLLKTGAKVVAVEKDDGLYEELKTKYGVEISEGKLELIHDDVLNFVPQFKSYKVVANIPYNITGAIIEKFLTETAQPLLMVLLVQKEVAERIVARDSKESILSISVKAYGKPHYIERVLAGSFVPAPKVDSAIIKIDGISKKFFVQFSEEDFFRLLKSGFQAKRKKLSSNLGVNFNKNQILEAFKELHLDENIRAEDIDVETWNNLGEILL